MGCYRLDVGPAADGCQDLLPLRHPQPQLPAGRYGLSTLPLTSRALKLAGSGIADSAPRRSLLSPHLRSMLGVASRRATRARLEPTVPRRCAGKARPLSSVRPASAAQSSRPHQSEGPSPLPLRRDASARQTLPRGGAAKIMRGGEVCVGVGVGREEGGGGAPEAQAAQAGEAGDGGHECGPPAGLEAELAAQRRGCGGVSGGASRRDAEIMAKGFCSMKNCSNGSNGVVIEVKFAQKVMSRPL